VHVQQKLGVSERKAYRILSQPRSVLSQQPNKSEEEKVLRADIIHLASTYGRYGYRRITALIRTEPVFLGLTGLLIYIWCIVIEA